MAMGHVDPDWDTSNQQSGKFGKTALRYPKGKRTLSVPKRSGSPFSKGTIHHSEVGQSVLRRQIGDGTGSGTPED